MGLQVYKGKNMYENENENLIDDGFGDLQRGIQHVDNIRGTKKLADRLFKMDADTSDINDSKEPSSSEEKNSDEPKDLQGKEPKKATGSTYEDTLTPAKESQNNHEKNLSKDSNDSIDTKNLNSNKLKDTSSVTNNAVKEGAKKTAETTAEAGIKVAAGETAKAAAGTVATVASSKVAIIVGIILAVVLFLVVALGVIYIYTTPGNITKVVESILGFSGEDDGEEDEEKSLWTKILEHVAEVNGLNDLKPTSDENLTATNVPLPVPYEDYDPEREQDVALIEEYKLIAVALSKAYNRSLVDIEEIVSEKGYDATTTMSVLKAKYPNGWQDVYKDVNYGTLISIYYYCLQDDIGLWEENDTSESNGNENEEESVSETEALLAELEEILLDEDNTRYFYHATFQIVENPTGGRPYLDITISPYCLIDMYDLIGVDPDDMYDDIFTYAEMQDVMAKSIDVSSEGTNGEKRGIYYALGMDKPQFPWMYTMGSNDLNNLLAYDNSGDENARILYSLLRLMGYNESGAAGVCGNIYKESYFSTGATGSALGIGMWTGAKKDGLIAYAQQLGLPVTNIYAQALYLIYDLELNPQAYCTNALKNASSLDAATDIFCVYYKHVSNYANTQEWKKNEVENEWNRYLYTSINGRYYLDLGVRRQNAARFYEQFKDLKLLKWPVPSYIKISEDFSDGAYIGNVAVVHNGIDIEAKPGSYVYAACAGYIAETGFDNERGNYVIMTHFGRYVTEYHHLRNISAVPGSFVTENQIIGTVGKTGNATEPHVHFAIKNANGNYISPLSMVSPTDNMDIEINAEGGVVEVAKSLENKIVYQWGGKPTNAGWNDRWDKASGNGLDCSGFVQWAYWTTTGRPHMNLGSTYSIAKTQTRIEYSQLQPGDLGMKFHGGSTENRTNHVGIYAGKNLLGNDIWIHCTGGMKDTVTVDSYSGFTCYYRVTRGD